MARYKGSQISNVFDSNKKFPLDTRMLVQSKKDLINPQTWITAADTNGRSALFKGMITVVSEDGSLYILANEKDITQANYDSYLQAFDHEESTDEYFRMWIKVADEQFVQQVNDAISALTEKVSELEDKKPTSMLYGSF